MAVDYRAVVAEVPELVARLCLSVVPAGSAQYGDSRPAPGVADPMNTPVRVLDDVESVMCILDGLVSDWQAFLTAYHDVAPVRGVRVRVEAPYGELVVAHPGVVVRQAWVACKWMLDRLGEILAHPLAHMFTDVVEHDLVPLVVHGRTSRVRKRDCMYCAAEIPAVLGTVVADVERGRGVCERCARVFLPQQWMPIKQVAELVGVTAQTIRNMVNDGAVQVRVQGRHRLVEVGACRDEHELRMARRRLGYATG